MLLIDAGNSRCKWARVSGGVWTHCGVVANADSYTLPGHFRGLPKPNRILVSNVGGTVVAQHLCDVCAEWSIEVEFVAAGIRQCGVSNRYEHPEKLGSDRWAALIAAWHNTKRACLVVNCGTATTVDMLSDSGEFLGGLILPGLSLMRHSLIQNTAQLADEPGQLRPFPQNTADAIYSGTIRATQGAIQYQYSLLKSAEPIACIVSGGAANWVQPHLEIPSQYVENLVLEGLQIIGEGQAC